MSGLGNYDAWKLGTPPEYEWPAGEPEDEPDPIPRETDYGIITRYDPPPIPMRRFDWTAYRPGYEPDDSGHPLGWGSAPLEAVADLLEQEEELLP